jgi:hypothetical protein
LAFACLFIHAETLHHHLCKKNCLWPCCVFV